MVVWWMLSMAWADAPTVGDSAPETEAEDVVYVWRDRFVRWRNTRWEIATELVLPTGFSLQSRNSIDFDSFALQLRVVMACDPEFEKRKMQVACVLEDVGVQATSIRRWRRDRDKEIVQRVLDELDEELTGAKIQLQANARGEIVNVDLDGLANDRRRDRYRAEMLRQLIQRVASPFHLQLPKEIRHGSWVELNSTLMEMPSATRSLGSSTIVHDLRPYEDYLLVQDIGEGVVELEPIRAEDESPNGITKLEGTTLDPDTNDGRTPGDDARGYATPFETTTTSSKSATSMYDTRLGKRDSMDLLGDGNARQIPTAALYKTSMSGVSIFSPETGVMKERVWSIKGVPTGQNLSQLPIWSTGRITLLAVDEKPDVGPTRQVRFPGMPTSGLPAWTPIDEPPVAAPSEPNPDH